MLGIAVTFIVCLVVRVSAAIRPGLPACIVVLFSGAGLKDYFSLQARLPPRHSTSTMAVAPAAVAPIATAANTRVTIMSGAETAALSIHEADYYSVSRDHLFAINSMCTSVHASVNDPGDPAQLG